MRKDFESDKPMEGWEEKKKQWHGTYNGGHNEESLKKEI